LLTADSLLSQDAEAVLKRALPDGAVDRK